MATGRVTKKVLDYIAHINKEAKQMSYVKDLKDEYKKENPDVKLIGDKFIGPKDEQ